MPLQYLAGPKNHKEVTVRLTAQRLYKKAAAGQVIDLNAAACAKLTTLHGTEPSFGRHIINYRSRLGGLYRKAQPKAVFGLGP
ncbi:MAG: hypothetical protein JWP78_1990 [Mucilaginibacter sp.]|nr:hypothetical protein [Mucilaginibacter sp.]